MYPEIQSFFEMTDDADLKADLTGKDTLHSFSRAYRFNQWMFDQIFPWASGKILEAGSGIGNISRLFIERKFSITLSDIMSDYILRLRRSFGNDPHVDGIVQLDLSSPDISAEYPELAGQFDTVVALNVIEHISDDALAIRNCRKVLRNQGRMIILVPAFQFLFNSLDTDLQHYRRYTKKTITKLMEENGFKVIHKSYFNFMGMVGWYISGVLMKNKKIPRSQLRIFEKLVPLFRLIDFVIFRSAGVSVIAVAEKVEN